MEVARVGEGGPRARGRRRVRDWQRAAGSPPRDALPAFDKRENSAFFRPKKAQNSARANPFFLEETEKSALRQPMLDPKNFVVFDKKGAPPEAGTRAKSQCFCMDRSNTENMAPHDP